MVTGQGLYCQGLNLCYGFDPEGGSREPVVRRQPTLDHLRGQLELLGTSCSTDPDQHLQARAELWPEGKDHQGHWRGRNIRDGPWVFSRRMTVRLLDERHSAVLTPFTSVMGLM